MSKPGAFKGLPDPEGLFRLLDKNPGLGAKLLAQLANAESAQAVEAAGFTPQRLRQAALGALDAGDRAEADELAGAFCLGSAQQAAAICSAYEFKLAHPEDKFSRRHFFEPDSQSPYLWLEMVKEAPQNAAMWARSPAFKPEERDFWRFVIDTAKDWEDEASLSALRDFADLRPGSIDEKSVAALGAPQLSAVMEGLARHKSWERMRGVIELLDSLMVEARDAGALVDEKIIREKALVVARACADFAPIMKGHPDVVDAIVELTQVDVEAGVVLARAAAGLWVNVKDMDGGLRQPCADVKKESELAVAWSAQKNYTRRAKDLQDTPSMVLVVGAMLGHWTSALGKRVAKASGAKSTPESEETFELLAQIGAQEPGSAARAALVERVELRATPQAASKPKILRV